MKPGDKISMYNVDFMHYASQIDWGNSVLCHCYYQRLPNQIQDSISTWKQEKPTSFQDMYALAITIDYHSRERDHECYYTRQAEKEALESHSGSKGKLPPLVLPQSPKTRQIHFWQPHLPKTFSQNHLHPPLPRNNLILCRWTSLPSWPAMVS